ncbi:enoyl-CoA hydratase-related protein (plasmid) [Rhizobium sp. RCAM05350]|uniref:enoyl-CoA hydratase/isomerase family protein n=1 Tax=Rhizobium sp. RCAM05350 TaxID=2895568 RepID=UPI002076B27D|nr:enoyl-CoA hydratase-related protein [Rhizobium sp. RCAM05350]URK89480.1 enoyl-CoA hydratase-related protein [Rhizobium sp. RCAM05350]
MLQDLNAAIGAVRKRAGLRCVILHGGTARSFCAGSDIREFAHLRLDASEQKILFEDMVLRNLAQIGVPTIAAIDGPAMGGGLELALACDLRVMRQGAKLGLTEARLGGLAGNGSVRLARLVGPARAKEMLFTGAVLDAGESLSWGVVNRITPRSALDAARELAMEIQTRGPLSDRFAKELVDAALDRPLDEALSISTRLQQRIFDSTDLHEGMDAFFMKRNPEFRGT